MSRALYRLAQFRRAIGARPDPAGLAEARCLLSDLQWRAFCRMSARDQWHGIETLWLLRHAGWNDAELELAALLHDTGKGYIRLHERVLYVLLAPFPKLLGLCASSDGKSVRGALYRLHYHAGRSAELALRSGAGERVARLIRLHHQLDPADSAAAALANADDRA